MNTNENALTALHELLATVLAAQVGETVTYTNEAGEEVTQYTASPALLAAASKFLKDNDITISIEDDANLGRLEEILKNKKQKGRAALAAVSPIDAAKQSIEG